MSSDMIEASIETLIQRFDLHTSAAAWTEDRILAKTLTSTGAELLAVSALKSLEDYR